MLKRITLMGMFVAVSTVAAADAQGLRPEPQPTVSNAAAANAAAQQADDRVRREARRLGLGVQGGVGIDPEIIDFGAHVTFNDVFKPNLAFRPGLEIGAGEVTTFLGINLDFVYAFPGNSTNEGWVPYVGAGPTFGLSHRGFEVDDDDAGDDDSNRFDFSDTDFNGGMNFIVGMRRNRMFFEMKATAWGVSNIRLVAGYNF